MKTSYFLFSFLFILGACGQKPKVAAIADEQPLILKTIEGETRAFYNKNHADWSRYYLNSPKVQWVCVEQDVTLRANGWNDLSQFVQQWMKENPEPMNYEAAQFKTENVQLTVQDSMAFVSMTGSNIQPDGSLRKTVGTRTLLKQNGEWKILSMTSYPNDAPRGSTTNVFIHGK